MKSSKIKYVVWAFAASVLLIAVKELDLQPLLKGVLERVDALGTIGIVVFIVLYVVCTVFFIPGSILTLGSGVLFGVVKGSVVVSLASISGATLAFLVGRYFVRDWIAKKIEGNQKFKAIDEAVAEGGWKIVGLTRLSPVFPFNLLNYAFGLTRVSLKDYFFASWIGMVPGTIMYVYIGSLAGDLATLGTGSRTRTPAEWTLYAVGLVATVVVTVYVTRTAKKALERRASI